MWSLQGKKQKGFEGIATYLSGDLVTITFGMLWFSYHPSYRGLMSPENPSGYGPITREFSPSRYVLET